MRNIYSNSLLNYQFQLSGEHESLTRASSEFDGHQEVSFLYFEEDGSAPEYYFGSVHLEELTSIPQVWDRATQLLQLYNAAHELVETTQSQPRLHYPTLHLECLFLNKDTRRNSPPSPLPLYTVSAFDSAAPIMPGRTLYGQLLSLARQHREAYQVLLQFSQVIRMSDYYRVLETIRTYLGSAVFDKMLSEKGLSTEYTRFKATSNNYDLGGENSRHGITSVDKESKKAKPTAMNKEEAMTLAMSVGRHFFTEKYGVIFPDMKIIEPSHEDPGFDEDF